MIAARDFVDAARLRGFEWYAGVPCSFLTPFINYVLQDDSLEYVSMANEGDAVALIAGVTLSGRRGIAMMQNSGLGNAVSPLTSLTWTFRLPQLLIVTWRGQPGITDEPQHALMGPITLKMLDAMEIPWELFPTDAAAIGPALDRAVAYMQAHGRPYALVMQKGSVAPYELAAGADAIAAPAARPVPQRRPPRTAEPNDSRHEALREVVAHTQSGDVAVLATTGFTGRELYAVTDRANQLYMVGSMGCVAPLALGLALARPDLKVVAIDGDGAALMRLGAVATVGAYAPPNLWHLLLDNAAHDSTGGQATVSPCVDFAAIAAACHYASATDSEAASDIGAWLGTRKSGPHFLRVRIRPGAAPDLPRPAVTPMQVAERFMRQIGARH